MYANEDLGVCIWGTARTGGILSPRDWRASDCVLFFDETFALLLQWEPGRSAGLLGIVETVLAECGH